MENVDEKNRAFLLLARDQMRMLGQYIFTWTIKNFDLCPNRWGQPLKSPTFNLYSWQSSKYHLMLYPRGINQDTSDHVSLYLVKNTDDNEVKKGINSCQLGVVTSQGASRIYERFEKPLFKGSGEGSPKFISREKLSKERDSLLADGNFTVFCGILAKNNPSKLKLKPTLAASLVKDEDLTVLSDSFAELYESERLSDMDVITTNRTFKIHKALLHARFPELLENVDGNTCSFESIGTRTMNALLQYLYSGNLNRSYLNLFDLTKSTCKIPSRLKSLLASETKNVQVATTLKQKTICFRWKIQNFSTLDPHKILQHSLIGDENCPWTWFNLYLSVSGKTEKSFQLTIERYSSECRRIICKTEILGGESKTYEHTFEKEDIWNLPLFITEENSVLKFSHNDEISLRLEIAVTDGSMTNETEKVEVDQSTDSDEEQNINDLKTFQNDLRNLLNDSKYSDVTLVAGKDKFYAHRFVLCARSTVFSEMFQKESQERDTVVTELDSWVVKNMLSYMYCGDIGFRYASTKNVTGMYTAANKYGMPGLKSKCVSLLESILSVENAAEILATAHEWDDKGLKESIYDFVLSHPEEIASSKEWKETMREKSDVVLEALNRALSYIASKK